jgi:hypothetical protein
MPSLDRRDYTEAAQAMRRPGASGKVLGHHDGHGLCYEVRHDDGTTGFYDPDELTGENGRTLAAP